MKGFFFFGKYQILPLLIKLFPISHFEQKVHFKKAIALAGGKRVSFSQLYTACLESESLSLKLLR